MLQGAVPPSEYDRMRCPFQEGDFPFPVKYGYGFVGEVVDGPAALLGKACMALSPHQEYARLPRDAVLPLPAGLPPRRAVLAANMETALNVLWDAEVAAGDRVLIAGAGVVGLLIAALAARIPGVEVTLADINPAKRGIAEQLGAAFRAPSDRPAGAEEDVDVAINASGAPEALRHLLERAGVEAKVVEASWHGDAPATLPLGAAFHARRLSIVSSQVGRIPARRAPRWTHRRRLAKALDLLAAMPEAEALITHDVPLSDAPARLPALIETDPGALCVAIRYEAGAA